MPDLRDHLQASLGDAYAIERELGGGGMARVFLATDRALGRMVVVKVLPPEAAAAVNAERFKREIAVAAQMTHAHIVPLFAAGEANGLPWYTMPFIDGLALRERLAREGELPVAECVRVLRDVAMALAYAHERGVVHRDIKPENVLLSGGSAMVTDFGVAKALSAATGDGGSITTLGMALGTPAYMAPEQASASPQVDHRADLYALGVLGYELLTGRTPFGGRSAQQTLSAHLTEAPEPVQRLRPTTPPALAQLVMRCLEKSAADRPQSAAEVVHDLDRIATPSGGTQPDTALAATLATPASAGTWRKWALVMLAGAVAATLIVVIARRIPARAITPVLDPKRVVIATFENRTGDPSLDAVGAMAADWIARGLTGAQILEVSGTSGEIAARMGEKVPAGSQDLDSLAYLARAGLVVSGAYYRRGDSLLIQADITDAARRNRVQSIGPIATLARAPDAGVEEIRVRVTGALAAVVDSTLTGVATQLMKPPSLEAYREYLAGEYLYYRDPRQAADRLLSAYRLDTSFNFALIRSARAYSNAGVDATLDSLLRILSTKRNHLSAFERAFADYVALGAGRPSNGYSAGQSNLFAARAMVAAAPRSPYAQLLLAEALVDAPTKHLREGVQVLDRLDPESGGLRGRTLYFRFLTYALHDLGDTAREIHEAERGRRIYGPRLQALQWQILAYATAGRLKAVDSLIPEVVRSSPDLFSTPVPVLMGAALELRAHGHAQATKRLDAQLLSLVTGEGSPPLRTFDDAFDLAMVQQEAGSWNGLLKTADTLRTLATDNHQRVLAIGVRGVALARTERRGEASLQSQALDSLSRAAAGPEKREIQSDCSFWRSTIAQALGDKPGALKFFEAWFEVNICVRMCHGFFPFLVDLFDYPPYQELVRPKQ